MHSIEINRWQRQLWPWHCWVIKTERNKKKWREIAVLQTANQVNLFEILQIEKNKWQKVLKCCCRSDRPVKKRPNASFIAAGQVFMRMYSMYLKYKRNCFSFSSFSFFNFFSLSLCFCLCFFFAFTSFNFGNIFDHK